MVKTTAEIAKDMRVCYKTAFKRLSELQDLNLAIKDKKGIWKKTVNDKEVIVL